MTPENTVCGPKPGAGKRRKLGSRARALCIHHAHARPAGHDRFSMDQAYRILGRERTRLIERVGGFHDGLLNMTYIALRFARHVNTQRMLEQYVLKADFPGRLPVSVPALQAVLAHYCRRHPPSVEI